MRNLALILGLLFTTIACTGPQKETVVYDRTTISDAASELEYNVGDRVFFKLNSASLSEVDKQVLQKQAEFMKQNSTLKFIIEGHCDERGTREYNLALGERRANSAKRYLVALGIDSDRLTVVSYGKERPAVLGSTPDAWKQNRRAVTVIK